MQRELQRAPTSPNDEKPVEVASTNRRLGGDDDIRIAAASLHAAIRKYRQTTLPLLSTQNRGLPVRPTTAAFAIRMAADVTSSALDCLRVVASERCGEDRLQSLLQLFSIDRKHVARGETFIEAFIADLKERLTLSTVEAGQHVGTSSPTERAPPPTSDTIACVPAIVVLRGAEILWAQRCTKPAERILWCDGVEQMLSVGQDHSPTIEQSSVPEELLRRTMVLSGMENVAGTSLQLQRPQELLVSVVELWCWCKSADNVNGADEVEGALNDPVISSLMRCVFPDAALWAQLKARFLHRAAMFQRQAQKREALVSIAAGNRPRASPERLEQREKLCASRAAARQPPAAAPQSPPAASSDGISTTARAVQPATPNLLARICTFLSSNAARRMSVLGVALGVAVLVMQLLMLRYARRAAAPVTRRALNL